MRLLREFFRFVEEMKHLNKEEGEKQYLWCCGYVHVQPSGDATGEGLSENLNLSLDSEAHLCAYALSQLRGCNSLKGKLHMHIQAQDNPHVHAHGQASTKMYGTALKPAFHCV